MSQPPLSPSPPKPPLSAASRAASQPLSKAQVKPSNRNRILLPQPPHALEALQGPPRGMMSVPQFKRLPAKQSGQPPPSVAPQGTFSAFRVKPSPLSPAVHPTVKNGEETRKIWEKKRCQLESASPIKAVSASSAKECELAAAPMYGDHAFWRSSRRYIDAAGNKRAFSQDPVD
jgi:hypothetical protein